MVSVRLVLTLILDNRTNEVRPRDRQDIRICDRHLSLQRYKCPTAIMSNLNPLAEDPGALDVASEIELKFALSAIELERVLQHPALRGRGRTQAMSSIYFDSPRLHLRRAGLTLRVRKSGRSMVQTVKRGRPTDLFNRDEWETPLQGAEPDWAAAACTPAGRVLSEAGVSLAPVFSTDIRRTVRVYSFRGATIELSVDQQPLYCTAVCV